MSILGQEHGAPAAEARAEERLPESPVDCQPKPIAGDPSVKYDFDIVYVRLPRKVPSNWAEVASPHFLDAGGDLMLLHPDGSEELLVAGGADGSIADLAVSFDGQWVYYSHFRGLERASSFTPSPQGADIYKVHVKSRQTVRLTDQTFTPNTGAANWSEDYRSPAKGKTHLGYGVINSGPCPVPGGKVVFTSNRNAHLPPTGGSRGSTLQLFVMDENGDNVEQIGHLNLGVALHPVVLKDGRVMFSSLEHQGLRGSLLWGLWAIHPDGTQWDPLISAFHTNSFHFQAQLSDGHIVAEAYYNASHMGCGTYFKFPPRSPEGTVPFYPADMARTPQLSYLPWVPNGMTRMPFQRYGLESLTRFATDWDTDAAPDRRVPDRDKYEGPRMGLVTHPAAAPDNHLLTVWSAGRVSRGKPDFDSGIYLIKGGIPVNEPGQMLLIKNDPEYLEQSPRSLVPYQRIYGISEPPTLPSQNDGKASRHLPEGTPFGLVGTSSLYKRESAPGRRDSNWNTQGADAGQYESDDIWGIRIVALEPTTDHSTSPNASQGRLFYNHAKGERMRILGELPVRHFKDGQQPLDPDGNPDTSFLAKIPADFAWTFQTLDKHGMVLNMAQTWHQLRPGEVRNNCGGCHAHSQEPTDFQLTAAAQPSYQPFDLTERTPLLTSKESDQSGNQWDVNHETGLRYQRGVKNIEFNRDIKPIFERSCAACHTHKEAQPAGDLVLDDDTLFNALGTKVPGTYLRLALDNLGGSSPTVFGHKPPTGNHWVSPQRASRYIWKLQSRRSLLVWKIFGQRMDGLHDEDFTTETVPGDRTTLHHQGRAVDAKTWTFADEPKKHAPEFSVGYYGSIMPPPTAMAGTYVSSNGKTIKVAPLTDEDRLTLVRWIDLGCPLDLDYDPAHPESPGFGWLGDDQRPTLALASPRPGANEPLTRIVVGMHDYGSGLDIDSFQAIADFPVDDAEAGTNLASRFKPSTPGVWEIKLSKPLDQLPASRLTVSVKDRQGNITRIQRTFSVDTSHRSPAE